MHCSGLVFFVLLLCNSVSGLMSLSFVLLAVEHQILRKLLFCVHGLISSFELLCVFFFASLSLSTRNGLGLFAFPVLSNEVRVFLVPSVENDYSELLPICAGGWRDLI